ncbi:MAG: ROK family protein [Calditrichia bacterium]
MSDESIVGVDFGATAVKVGRVEGNHIAAHDTVPISARGSEKQVLNEILQAIEKVFDPEVAGIGIGVPSLVDVEKGVVYNVQNIPSWKEVQLKQIVEERFRKPVYVNNDANCFAVGEKYYGKGKPYKNMVGLTIGTGLGAGVIINNRLYAGINCGAGEFGSIPYLDGIYEDYCSGQFFANQYGRTGTDFFDRAKNGDRQSLEAYEQFGKHLGEAIKTILFAVDPEALILGGSISQAFPFFKEAMRQSINDFPYKRSTVRLVVEPGVIPQIAILGAAALYFDAGIQTMKR